MIVSLDIVIAEFKDLLHLTIVQPKEFMDFTYMGHTYRVKITHRFKNKPSQQIKYVHANRTKRIPPRKVGVSKCVTCGGPSVGPVCMLKACDVVIAPTA